MPSWYLKAAVQGTLARMPARRRLNYVMQRHITKNLTLDTDLFEGRLKKCWQHFHNYARATSVETPPAHVIDLGTGWHPIIPVGLFLCGVSKIWSVDIDPLVYRNLLEEMLIQFVAYAENGRLKDFLPGLHEERLPALQDALNKTTNAAPLDEVFAALHIELWIADAQHTGLEPGSIDLFTSNYTLEHVPGEVICGIFAEFRRLAKPTAAMSHLIDVKDHYANFDGSITPYNFLKFSDRTWRWFNNDLLYQNRCRLNDYRRLHEETGFRVVFEDHEPGDVEQFRRVELAPQFQNYASDEDMSASLGWFVSVPT
ncbi:MAG: class I SAM-dependent methyltransferase [Anaerolineae bacterium]|nr:class I SAM-dependent methyltransferase [Anaerolineae bacterium]